MLTPSFVIQLGLLSKEDSKVWWVDHHLWDIRESEPDTVQRPTEIAAFNRLYRQSRLMRKKGMYVSLSPLHLHALQLEHYAMSKPPIPDNVYQWVSERMAGVPPLQVKGLLDEASLVILLRESLGLPPLAIDWQSVPTYTVRRKVA